jgi:hypothetical protein
LQPLGLAGGQVEKEKEETEAMSSAPIYRASLGYVAQLGDLYDARTDNFTGYSMLRGKLPPDAISTSPNFSQHAEVFVTESTSDQSDKFDISAELRLAVRTNLVSLDSTTSAGYVTESRSSRKALQAVLVYDMTTDVETVNVISDGLKNSLALDVLGHSVATHVVCGVYWGAKALLTITDENVNESDKKTVQTKLETKLTQVATTLTKGQQVTDLNVIDSSFKIEMFSDIRTSKMPTTFAQAVALMYELPGLVKETNNGRGKPVKFQLFPLADVVFRTHVGLPVPAPFVDVKPLDETLVDAFVDHFDDITQFRREVKDYRGYIERYLVRSESGAAAVDLLRAVQAVEVSLAEMEKRLRKQVGELMVSVRSGTADVTQLEELIGPAKDELTSHERKLSDSVSKPEHVYSVKVYTGNKSFAGTDANVFLKLFGKYSESTDIPLLPPQQTPIKNCFERDQKDTFAVEAPLLLRLTKLRIWHDNTGSYPGWYLDKVVVRDTTSREEYQFPCYRWLADEANYQLACDLLPSNIVTY